MCVLDTLTWCRQILLHLCRDMTIFRTDDGWVIFPNGKHHPEGPLFTVPFEQNVHLGRGNCSTDFDSNEVEFVGNPRTVPLIPSLVHVLNPGAQLHCVPFVYGSRPFDERPGLRSFVDHFNNLVRDGTNESDQRPARHQSPGEPLEMGAAASFRPVEM